MKHVPKRVQALKSKQLEILNRWFSDAGAKELRGLAQDCIESIEKTILNRAPAGNTLDYYEQGYQKGLMEAHRLYLDLAMHVKAEIGNREEMKKDEEDSLTNE